MKVHIIYQKSHNALMKSKFFAITLMKINLVRTHPLKVIKHMNESTIQTGFSRKTNPKARSPNKMTRSRIHKKVSRYRGQSSSLSGWCYDHRQETVIVVKIVGVLGAGGNSTMYTLGKVHSTIWGHSWRKQGYQPFVFSAAF